MAIIDQIKAHPVCAEFMALPGQYVVYYPSAYVIPGGLVVQRSGNDDADLAQLLAGIDAFWQAQLLRVPADPWVHFGP